MLTHSEAVRIARGGEGAVVCELLRLSEKADCLLALAEQRGRKLEAVADWAESPAIEIRALAKLLEAVADKVEAVGGKL